MKLVDQLFSFIISDAASFSFPILFRETEGSGITDEAVKLINQLQLRLGSITAGNSSIKLKNQVLYLLNSLVELGTINKKQKKKIISDYIKQ